MVLHSQAFVPAKNVVMYIAELHGTIGERKVLYGVAALGRNMVREYVILLPFKKRIYKQQS